MSTEMTQNVTYHKVGKFNVSNELFLDLIFNSRCNCRCKFCIAETPSFAKENFERWKENLVRTFNDFDIRNIIILGGEATIDPIFFEKLDFLREVIKGKNVDNVVLTTNGIMFRSKSFMEKLLSSCVTTVNLSYMNYDKKKNDSVMRGNTLTRDEVKEAYFQLKKSGRTMRLNVNVFHANCNSVEEMNKYVDTFNGCADIIKFSPLMPTDMFGTVEEVRMFTNIMSLSHEAISTLYDDFASVNNIVYENDNVFGLVNYKEVERNGQHVILKYAQVEDTYDLDCDIPTLKLYNNGNLSNEWQYEKDILPEFEAALMGREEIA